jgi:hypothetical protein
VRANLVRFGQLALVKRIVTLGTFYKDAFGFDGAFFVLFDVIDLWFISAKP